jgi:hypothetical protein
MPHNLAFNRSRGPSKNRVPYVQGCERRFRQGGFAFISLLAYFPDQFVYSYYTHSLVPCTSNGSYFNLASLWNYPLHLNSKLLTRCPNQSVCARIISPRLLHRQPRFSLHPQAKQRSRPRAKVTFLEYLRLKRETRATCSFSQSRF